VFRDFDSGRMGVGRNWRVGLCLAIGIMGVSGNVSLVRAQTSTAAIQTSPAIASSTVALNRIALTILPKPAAASARADLAQADEELYRKRLRELGFEVRTIAPANRFDLDRTLREAALGIPAGSEVAVLLLGNAFAFEDDVRIVPADASSDLASAPDRLETETLRLSDFLRRVSSRLPRNLVVIVDECADLDTAAGKCRSSQSVGSTGASIFSAFRRPSTATADRTLSNALSLRTNLLSLMTREGLSFSQLQSELARQLSGSNLALDASAPLSETFAFLPSGFFGGISNECNQVDLAADAMFIRSADLAPKQAACEKATGTWPYSNQFAERLVAVKEQRAYQTAVASCNDPIVQSAFAATYPTSRFRRVVDAFWVTCASRSPAPAPSPPPADPAPNIATQLRQGTVAFLDRWYREVASGPIGAALDGMNNSYANQVFYFGSYKSREEIVAAELRFFTRWPNRQYRPRPDSVQVDCDTTLLTCTASGLLDYDARNPASNQRSWGSATFEYKLQFTTPTTLPKIVLESGQVKDRHLDSLDSLSANQGPPPTIPSSPMPQVVQAPQTPCDDLAANSTDRRKLTTVQGVAFVTLRSQADRAITACESANANFPNEQRFQYQLARALEFKDRARAFGLHEKLSRLQYPAAFDNLGSMYLNDRNDPATAVRYFVEGVRLEDPDSMVSLADMIEKNYYPVPNPVEVRLALFKKAAELGNSNAARALSAEMLRSQRTISVQDALQILGSILQNVPTR
jgi:hypothetical protein